MDGAWAAHCCDESGLLSQYASAMHRIATDIWPLNSSETRIDWCYKTCMDYFFGGGLKRIRDKAVRRQSYQLCAEHKFNILNDNGNHKMQSLNCAEEMNSEVAVESSMSAGSSFAISLPFCGKIRLLDAGSCYNPFQAFAEFSVVGIDIFPAVNTVFKSDLLNLNLTAPLKSDREVDSYFDSLQRPDSKEVVSLNSFVAESCHVVVFSLLLEYLPTSRQRVACCRTAWKLLVIDGLLLIATPDSRQQHRNRRFTRDWRKAIESIGFSRFRYEKLQHLHCMAFRKVATDDCRPRQPDLVDHALCIAQDKDSAEDADTPCDMPYYVTHKDAAEDVPDVFLESETYHCSELLGTVLY